MTTSASTILLPALLILGVGCGDDSVAPGGSGGGTSSVTVSVSVSSATSTATATTAATGTGGESSGGGGDGGAGAGQGTGGQGVGGGGGAGGEGGAPGTGGQGGGTTTGDPIDCVVCIATECPQIAECIADPACRDGLVCTLTGCIVDGEPDLLCISECFGGDFGAALAAIEALACVVTTCGEGCGGLIPGA